MDAFDNCEDPIEPEAQSEAAPPESQERIPKPDPDFNTEFGIYDSLPPPTPEAAQSTTWADWIAPILLAPSNAASQVKSFFSNPANP